MTATRRLAAILAADVAGYSRLMGADEAGTLAALKAHRGEVMDPAIAAHRGRIVKTTGDGVLAEFASAVDAVTCAMAVQERMAERNGASTGGPKIAFRIGINVGDIIAEGDDIFGDGVNVAARVENECTPGGVCVSGNAFEQVRGKTAFAFDDLGERTLKNIDRPVRLYAVRRPDQATAALALAQDKPLALPDKPSIAVLPFQNMSGDPEQEYFADGVVEDIITALSCFKSLFVIARNSTFTYKGRAIDIKQVGRELGVRYVLEGSVRKAGGRVRITGQLIEATTGAHLWADRFDGALEDVFELQDHVTEQVVGAIAPQLQRVEILRARTKRTENFDAYDCYLQALAHIERPAMESIGEALRFAMKAIELDPDYAPAYGLAAYCYAERNGAGLIVDREHEIAEAVRLARRAAELGPDDSEALARGGCAIGALVSFESGRALLDRALQLNPNLASGWSFGGWGNVGIGEHDRAVEYFERAMRLNPANPRRYIPMSGIATARLMAGFPEEAFTWADKADREQPDAVLNLRVLTASAALTGRTERTRDALARLLLRDVNNNRLSKLRGHLAENLHWRRPEDIKTMVDALALAGMPE